MAQPKCQFFHQEWREYWKLRLYPRSDSLHQRRKYFGSVQWACKHTNDSGRCSFTVNRSWEKDSEDSLVKRFVSTLVSLCIMPKWTLKGQPLSVYGLDFENANTKHNRCFREKEGLKVLFSTFMCVIYPSQCCTTVSLTSKIYKHREKEDNGSFEIRKKIHS